MNREVHVRIWTPPVLQQVFALYLLNRERIFGFFNEIAIL